MVELRSEEEQIETLKRWWKENGWSTVLGVLVVLALYSGWQTWQSRKVDYHAAASISYQQLLNLSQAVQQQPSEANRATVTHLVDELQDEYGDTAYARYAALLQASILVDAGDLAGAEQQLRWVLDSDPDSATEQLTQLRLARVLFSADRNDEALAIANDVDEGVFTAEFLELQGDISFQGGELAAARGYYQRALSLGRADSNPMVKMKLEALPGVANDADEREG